MQNFEKLGVFYLGKRVEPDNSTVTDDLILYDSKDLTTHAVIVGMTGSGKTGLGVGMIEEAAIDHIPVIAIDPKGDLGNLLLAFPELQAEDFAPWVDPRAAAEAGQSTEDFAASQANSWKEGLASWGQEPARITMLKEAADFALYTPGSSAGLPLSVLKTFAPPTAELAEDADLWQERVQATVTGILTLLGLSADPLSSREHILLSNILDHVWKKGQAVDLAGLISLVQRPPMSRVGVLDLEGFFPATDRQAFALRMNNLLAAPGFDAWTRGEPLSADGLLFTEDGKPRVSVLSIAHLDDDQRMFFVTLLLAELIAWMRRQPGTPSLRAILYMDEVFGYMPPVANPPSKKLLLTLLKQARAYGLGIVLATQNPVDLDYKGLANAGTWFIGRLQTERDKARVLDGLLGASGSERLDSGTLGQTLAGLGKRQFLLHNVNEERPEVFTTRWVMSYLAGPLTREQIRQLMAVRAAQAAAAPEETPAHMPVANVRPALPATIKQLFVPAGRLPHEGERLVYQPRVLAATAVSYSNVKLAVNEQRKFVLAAKPPKGEMGVEWAKAEELSIRARDLENDAEPDAVFGEVPEVMMQPASFKQWDRQFRRWIGLDRALTIYKCERLGETSGPGESKRAFRIRLQQVANEKRDLEAARLKQKYASKFKTLEGREMRARQAHERKAGQVADAKVGAMTAVGTAVLGALLGRGRSVTSASRIGTAVRRSSSVKRKADEVGRAQETLEQVQTDKEALERQFQEELARTMGSFDAQTECLKEIVVRPRAGDIELRFFGVGWVPYIEDAAGELVPA